MSELDAVAERSLSFLFTRCQARLDGDDLVVAVPTPQVSARAASGPALAWDEPQQLDGPVTIECDAGEHQRADSSEYPLAQAYPQSVEFRFTGAVWYGRVPLRDGWALCVQGAVQSLDGLPAEWASRDAILVETTFTAPERPVAQESSARQASQRWVDGGGPGNGPHLPYP
jgi:hypothetical protein